MSISLHWSENHFRSSGSLKKYKNSSRSAQCQTQTDYPGKCRDQENLTIKESSLRFTLVVYVLIYMDLCEIRI